MTIAADATTLPARPRTRGLEGESNWEHLEVADFVTRFVDRGGFVVEIDGLSSGVAGEGRGGFPRRRLLLAPFDYVRAIDAAGLGFEGDYAARLAGECVVGGFDFDYSRSVDLFDPGFNSRSDRRLRVRTLDVHLENLPQPSVLIFGGYGADANILRSGRRTIAEHLPIIVARPTSREDLDGFSAALREIADYEWIARPGSGAIDGTQAHERPYHVAVAAGAGAQNLLDERPCETIVSSLARKPGNSLRTASLGSAPIRITPDKLIASRGFHGVERLDRSVWRWGGALPRLSALLEVPGPGRYEIRIVLANAIPGALESIDGVTVNGALFTDVDRRPTDLFFVVEARVARHILVEINCPRRQTTPPDPRQLSIALAEFRLRRLWS